MPGLAAGAVGTGAMTAHQALRRRLAANNGDASSSDAADAGDQADPWQSAPAPAKVAERVVEAVFNTRLPARSIPLVTQLMHWSYGISWGPVYALARESGAANARPPLAGTLLGSAVWASSYAELVPMGIYEPPWRYSPGELAEDFAYHLTYGLAVALTYGWLRARL